MIVMPLGKYKTWGECITAQMKKGYKKKQSEGICGLIEKRHKEKLERSK